MSSRRSSSLVASMACIWAGRRPNHNVLSNSFDTVDPANVLRCRRNCDGFRSPSSSRSKSWRILCSWESVRRCIKIRLSVLYLSVVGGRVIMSLISLACVGSIFDKTCAYFASSSVIPQSVNCPSNCINHNSGSSGQKGGIRTAIFEMCVSSSSMMIASFLGILSSCLRRGHQFTWACWVPYWLGTPLRGSQATK